MLLLLLLPSPPAAARAGEASMCYDYDSVHMLRELFCDDCRQQPWGMKVRKRVLGYAASIAICCLLAYYGILFLSWKRNGEGCGIKLSENVSI